MAIASGRDLGTLGWIEIPFDFNEIIDIHFVVVCDEGTFSNSAVNDVQPVFYAKSTLSEIKPNYLSTI